ncbi:MAG: hypothetical protein ACRD82_24425 [Blastocatellia bacterium]
MITTTLNVLHQTRHLGGSVPTGVYDDGEMDALLNGTADCSPSQIRGTQTLSPELLAQILAGEFIQSANGGRDGKGSSFGV